MKYLAFIITVLLLVTCKKDEPSNQSNYIELNENLKNNFLFKIGSYWIYEDQSLQYDSIILINRTTGYTSTCPRNACYQYEYYELIYKNINQNITYNHYYMSNFIRYNGGGEWGEDGQPIYITNQDQGYEFNGLLVGEKINSLPIFANTYYNVEKMTIQEDKQHQNEFNFDTDLFFAPNIGIVKIVIHDTINGIQTWDLKRYHLE